MPDDYYVSQYSGEEIDALLGGAGAGTVRYDAAQTLTDEQKAQARGNINAAPGGFGYGENQIFQKWDDNDGSQFEAFVDQMIDGASKVVRLTQVADYPANVVSGNSGFADIQINPNGCVLVLFHGPVSTVEGSIDGVYHASKKRLINGTWLPWEYDNPPLNFGVEYRTTERYLGKPVYVKVVNCGRAPSNSMKKIDTGLDYTVINERLTPTGNMYARSEDNFSIPCGVTNVVGEDLNITHGTYIDSENVRHDTIFIYTTSTSLTGYTVYVVLKYTKTTS